jgi:hypothetical protein
MQRSRSGRLAEQVEPRGMTPEARIAQLEAENAALHAQVSELAALREQVTALQPCWHGSRNGKRSEPRTARTAADHPRAMG